MTELKIGDVVYWPRISGSNEEMVCPDCQGKRYLTVIMGDDSQVTIDCAGCAPGWEGPSGRVSAFQHVYEVMRSTITRIEKQMVDGVEKIEYGTADNYRLQSENIFTNREDAEKRGKIVVEEWSNAALQSFYAKEKPTRDWAWDAHYHRKKVKEAKTELAYHLAKLDVASKMIEKDSDK